MSNLVISGVIDGPLTGGLPKAIELFALDDIPDLSLYAVGSANNGGGSDGEEYSLSGTASAGDYFYVATEATGFQDFFGFAPTVETIAASINGDDAIELFLNGTVVDVFGDINVDGTGQPWEYMDGWAYRKVNTGPDGNTFNLNNWSFSGVDALDGTTTNATAATPFPLGQFDRNNAPVLNGNAALTGLNEDVAEASNSGTTVTDLLAQVTVADADQNLIGIAVTGVDETNGSWQFSLDGGATWQDFTGTEANNDTVTLGATSLYTYTSGTTPENQGQLNLTAIDGSNPIFPIPIADNAVETLISAGVLFDTTADIDYYAGYANYVPDLSNPFAPTANLIDPNFSLTNTAGYAITFNLDVLAETRTNNDRAAFSLVAVSEDTSKAIEIGFQRIDDTTGNIFAQAGNGANLFTAAESVSFNTNEVTRYTLNVLGDTYELLADGASILTGNLRSYTDFTPAIAGVPDPYELPSYIFLGDNTTSAQGRFILSDVAVSTETLVRFLPNADYNGNATIDFLAWDTTDGSSNGQTGVDASVTGGATAFSTTNSTGTITVTPVNDAPTLTSFADVVDTTNENTQVELTFAELAAQGDEADVDGTVDGFVVQSVTIGTLLLGADAASATAYVVGSNDTIDATTNAYWTPDADADGAALDAFIVLARDDQGATSTTPAVTVQVAVTAIGSDIPTLISGSSGTDNLVGTPGKDNLVGYAGHDTLTGGAGSDQFVITDISDRQDTIIDFTPGTDAIHLVQLFDKHGITAATYTDAAAQDYLAIVADGAGGSVVRFDPNGNGGFFDFIAPVNLLTAQGVAPVSLANDAHFVLQ